MSSILDEHNFFFDNYSGELWVGMLIDRTIVGDDTLLTQSCSNLAMSAKK